MSLPSPGPTSPGLRACFDILVELPAAERGAWLDANVLDAALRDQLQKLLAADGLDDAAVPVLSTGAAALAAGFTPESDEGTGLVGTDIGPYRLTAVLGQGGTSIVFRAERRLGEGVQVVALKLLRTGLFSADGQRRFRREQGVLSQLSHPHIAALIDGGISAGGIPYIVMEFVDGVSITDYANANALDLPARLRLFASVCRAVDSAHRALVVHRDIKPSNVLVSREGQVKVLDFGIAQLLDDGSGLTPQTQAVALTPGYAAPEQYRPGPVTTATDVHALGVLLGELLTGNLPRTPTTLSLSRRIAHDSSDAAAGLPAVATLRRLLRGDLDAIHATACAAEPERRYRSAALLAEDIERYLDKRPVTARAPSLSYRLRKFMQRNRVGASAAVLGTLALVIGVSTALWQAQVAREESRRATAVSNFLRGLFEASKSGKLPEQRLTLEQVVQRAGERLQQDSELSAATRIEMLCLLADVGMAASDFPQADRLLDQAAALAAAAPANDAGALLRIALLRGHLRLSQTRYADAAEVYETVLPQIRAGADEASIRGLQNYALALMFSARTDAALAISADASRAAVAHFGPGSQGAVLAALEQGVMLASAGRSRAAAAVIEPALQRWRDAKWPPTREFLRALSTLSNARLSLGDVATAERYAREVLGTGELIYPPPHAQTAWALVNLGDVLILQEQLDEAESLLLRALELFHTIYGKGQMRDANTLGSLVHLYWRRGDLAAAGQALRQAQPWCAKPGLHPTRTCLVLDTVETEVALALGELDRATAASTRGLTLAQAIYRDGSSSTVDLLQLRAGVQLAGGDAAAALASCDTAYTLLQTLGETGQPLAVVLLARRADALAALRRYPEALADIQQALTLWQQLVPGGRRQRAGMLTQLAQLQAASGDSTAATETANAALALAGPGGEGAIDPARLAALRTLAKPAAARAANPANLLKKN